ncbi:beta transducin [Fusarium globosum]|uniref:Beta transducin n=1 Tax=Fusarium globosum TaxID=78864 RepID=A0A8H5YL85_9HYPO|nr:beta transducin [Fusarium globosum]
MRLINALTLELHEFFNENTPPYAILSHAWGDQEVSFQDWQKQNRQQVTWKSGYSKILKACHQALNHSLEWLWVDTNCIDKSSSAELTEAINSMFAYYQKSQVCYAYLADVPTANQDVELLNSELRRSRWFTRGWTLQELIAPRQLVFYAADWSSIGSKDDALVDLVTSITEIDSNYLTGHQGIFHAPVSKRMSWLAKRTTTRIEDMAYCMLGIFDINMPLLYGEGKRAFFRLQEEIIKSCNDHTIFCWGWNEDVPVDWASLLAPWPSTFAGAGGFKRESSENVSVFSMTNAGLSIRLPVIGTVADRLISSHSWFVMLQAAPATVLPGLEAVCLRVVGRRVGNQLYVSRSPYPPRPRTISMWIQNFKEESLLVMNKLPNEKVFGGLDPTRPYNTNALSFVPIFGSASLTRRWEFGGSHDSIGNISASSQLGEITWWLNTDHVEVAAEHMMAAGKNPESGPYILLGAKKAGHFFDVSVQLVEGLNCDAVLRSQAIEEALRHFQNEVETKDPYLKISSSDERQGDQPLKSMILYSRQNSRLAAFSDLQDMAFETSNNTLSPPQTPPAWSVIQFTFSDRNTDSELVVMCNNKRFVIRLLADTFSESARLKERYLFFLQVAEEFELDGVAVEDFWDWIVDPLLPIFRELPTPDQAAQRTLGNFFNPETFVYTFQTVSDERIPQLDRDAAHQSPFGISVPDELCALWKSFDPSEVRICQEKVIGPPSDTPRKVLLNDGTIAFLKLVRRGDKQSLTNELDTYEKIHRAELDNKMRISRLHGLVRNNDGVTFGLLLTYVDCGRVTLSCALRPETEVSLRAKWAAQVQEAIAQLHDAGIVWGDAKPDNILIDVNEDAWLIDFGGGYTEGWVPKILVGTMEGDRIALEKILEYIRN